MYFRNTLRDYFQRRKVSIFGLIISPFLLIPVLAYGGETAVIPSTDYNYDAVCSYIDDHVDQVKKAILPKISSNDKRPIILKTVEFNVRFLPNGGNSIIIYLDYGQGQIPKSQANRRVFFQSLGVTGNIKGEAVVSLGCDARTLTVRSEKNEILDVRITANFVD